MATVDIDRNLLFAVMALQDDLIDQPRFVDVCSGWSLRMETPLAELLLERHWISESDRVAIERKIERKIQKYGGVRATLAAIAGSEARDAIRDVADAEIRRSLSSLPPVPGHVLAETMVLPHRTEQSRYSLIRLHAQGGLGKIWLARDGDLGREVAIKEILPLHASNPGTWRRFLREAQITGQLEHPNIVPVYELSRRKEDDQPFYVMRFVRGQSLLDAVRDFHRNRDGKPLEGLALLSLLGSFLKVCDAVSYAHSRGVVHRDLKPENIVLGGFGEVIVLDWGLAKLLEQPDNLASDKESAQPISINDKAKSEQTQGLLGSPAYMAPEQVEQKHELVDRRTDIYALGAMLFEILTNHPPAEATTVSEVFEKIKAGRIPRACQLDASVPRPLEAICAKAMATERKDRYATTKDLSNDVRCWIADEPVSVYRGSFIDRGRRWARRHRTTVSSLAAAVLAGIVVLSVAAVQIRLAYKESEKQRRQAEAALDFLKNDVLAAARPEGQEGGLGVQVTLRQAIDAAEPKIATAFKDHPLGEAEIRDALGRTYLFLGDAEVAQREFLRAVELNEKNQGLGHPDTLASMQGLATSYFALGRQDEALKLRQRTLDLRKAKQGPDDPDTLKSTNDLATSYFALGRHAEALELRERTLEMQKARLGADHPDTLASMQGLAFNYTALGRHAEALKLREQTLEKRKAKLGPDHPDTLASMQALAHSYAALGDYREALKLREPTLQKQKAKLGPDHPYTLWSMNSLASSYFDLGRYAEALELREQTLKLRKAKQGPDHFGTLQSMNDLATSYAAMGRHSEALKLREQTLEKRKAKLGADHLATLQSMNDLACSYCALGRYDEALRLYEQTVEKRKAKLGADHPDTLKTMNDLANCYATMRRNDEALRLYEQTVEKRKAKLGADHPDTLKTMSGLANCYAAMGRHAEALRFHEQTLEKRKAKLGADHPDTLKTMSSLASSYAAMGRHVEALKLREATLELRRSKLGADHPDTLQSTNDLASSYAILGRHAEALKLHEQMRERQRAKPAPDQPDARAGVIKRGDSYADLRGHAEAQRNSKRTVTRLKIKLEPGRYEPLPAQVMVAASLLELGHPAEAAALAREAAEQWEKQMGPGAISLYNAGRIRAITSRAAAAAAETGEDKKRASAEADRAMDWLKQAVAAGWNDAAKLQTDHELDSLRDREDFERLLGELYDRGFPDDPFAR